MMRVAPAGWLGPFGWAGAGLALLAALTVIVLPAGWLTIGLATLAVLAFAREPSLGWIPGALLVGLAIPFGRGADLAPLTVGGIPVRPHDAIIGLAVLGPALRLVSGQGGMASRPLDRGQRTLLLAAALFAGIGIVALGWGLLEGQAARDVLRDARWWFLYLLAPLALLAGTRREATLRALVIGASVFGLAVVATLALPSFDGGLKEAAVQADSGAMRMQYGNTIFLVPVVALLTYRLQRRPSAATVAALGLTFVALVMALTRISILVALGLVIALIAAHAVVRWRTAGPAGRWRAVAGGLGVLAWLMASATAGVLLLAAVTFAEAGTGRQPTHPLERLLFVEEGSDLDAVLGSAATGGRLATYLDAFEIYRQHPLIGAGLGQQFEVEFATRPGRVRVLGRQPGVDNAYLTVSGKAGTAGLVAFAGLLLLPSLARLRARGTDAWPPELTGWYAAAWLGVLVLTLTQSFAVSGYAPFGIALLIALPFLPPAERDMMAA